MARIVAMLETSGGVGRTLLRQLGMWGRVRGHQMMHLNLAGPPPSRQAIAELRADVLIAMIREEVWAERIGQFEIPVINASVRLDEVPFPSIRFDDVRIGELAAEHLLQCNYPHFAYIGISRHAYSRHRLQGFQRLLAGHGKAVHRHEEGVATRDWDTFIKRIGPFIADLPKPVGIATCNDGIARQALHACNGRFKVPDDVAIVGADNDTLICEFTEPPLSSVDPGPALQAKALLDGVEQLLAGRTLPHDQRLEPAGLVARGTSDLVVADDPLTRSALAYIRRHATKRTDVGKVAEKLGVSRRTLERAFAANIGRTPAAEIRRVQIETAKRLLVETDLLLAKIAEECGYEYLRHFTEVFKREVGQTPTEYRTRFVAS